MTAEEVKKLNRRVKRAAQTLREGAVILEFFQEPKIRSLLVEGAKEDVPPVSKVSDQLLAKFGDDVKQMPVRQFCGMAVKAVLAEEGFELEDTGVRIFNDAVFSSGATYAKAAEEDPGIDYEAMLRNMVESLDGRQLNRLRAMIDNVL